MPTFTQLINPNIDYRGAIPGAVTNILLKPGVAKNQVEKNLSTFLQVNIKGAALDHQLMLKPLREGLLSPLRSKYHWVILCTLPLTILPALAKSVVALTRSIFKMLGTSAEKSHQSSKQVAVVLAGQVFSETSLALLITFIVSAGAVFTVNHFLDFAIGYVFSVYTTVGLIVIILTLVFSIVTSFWVSLMPPFHPIETYFSKKKGYGQR